jgi:Tol biopolymer transport system component
VARRVGAVLAILASAAAVVASTSGAASTPNTLAFVSRVTSTLTLTTTGLIQQPLLRARNVTAFTWSPDGRRIAFASAGAVRVMNADGSGVRRLQAKPLFGDFTWSPDGRKLAFSAAAGGDIRILVARIDGGPPKVLTSAVSGAVLPSWSPRGSSIAFTSANTNFAHIYTVREDGSGLRKLTSGRHESFPSWSPDGRWILFQPYICLAGKCGYAISVMRPDGSGKRRLAHVPGAPGAGGLQAAWSPDSRRIAFVRLRSHGIGYDVLSVGVTDTRVRALADDARSGSPSWAPDGRRIAYTTTLATINVMNADGSENRVFVEDGALPAWRPRP